MADITVLIYTKKNDPNIDDCLASAKLLTEEIILVYPESLIVEAVREKWVKQAKTDWVFILDADERMTKDLAEEIKSLITNHHSPVTNLKVPRKNIFGEKKWLKHGGWWPDYQIRLINKKYFVSWPKRIHSTPKIKGDVGYLKNPIIHYFHGDLNSMVKKTIIFEDIESDLLFKAKRKTGTGIFFRKYLAELFRRLFKNLGFLDGPFGIIEAIYQAFSKTITYLFLYEKQLKESRPL
jgi:hypothetical protein